MNQREGDVKKLRKDIDAHLGSFVLALAHLELIADFNDCIFEGKLALEEARALRRVIDGIEPNEAGRSVVKSCLARLSDASKMFGLDAMAYEARALMVRLDVFEPSGFRFVA